MNSNCDQSRHLLWKHTTNLNLALKRKNTVDALASRKLSRLGKTIQLSDTGISPGAGVGNNRARIDEETLGIPVIAIGIPTVVDGKTLVCDLVENNCKIDNISKEMLKINIL